MKNADKVVCPRGHPYSPENTITIAGPLGTFRRCRTCEKARKVRERAR